MEDAKKGPIDLLLAQKKNQIEQELLSFPKWVEEELQKGDGYSLEQLLHGGSTQILLHSMNIKDGIYRRLAIVMPGLIQKMNEENHDVRFSLIKGTTIGGPLYVGILIRMRRSEAEKEG